MKILFLIITLSIGKVSDSFAQRDAIKSAKDSLAIKKDSSAVVNVAPQKEAIPDWNGEITLSTGFYKAYGLEEARGQILPYSLNGKLTLTTPNGWILPITMICSSQNSRFIQPYNQIGATPTYKKWLILHGGYRNVSFSPLTLAGHTFLGGGIELSPGKFRFGAIYGKFNRAIESNYINPDVIPVFKRTGFSVKLGVGSKINYLDLIVLKVADDLTSISLPIEDQSLKAAENLAIGISSRLKIMKKLSFELDVTASAYTRDVKSETIERFVDLQLPLFANKLFTPRLSSQFTTALQSSLAYKTKGFNLKLQYKDISPEFRTMGAYYFQNDIKSYTLSPNFSIFKSKLKLNTSIGFQHDNLLNQKKVQTNRLIGSAAIVFAPNEKFSIDFLFSNYGITQKAGYIPLNDTLRLAQNNKTISANALYMTTGETIMQTFTATAVYQELQDLNSYTAAFNENQNWNYSAGYSFQHLVSNIDFSINYSYTLTKSADMTTLFHGPTGSLGKRFLKNNNLSISTNLSYMLSEQMILDFAEKGNVLNSSIDLGYTLKNAHTISINVGLISNKGLQNFFENRGTIGYQLQF